MTDDPSPRELGRSIDRVERRVDALASDLVGRREYEQRIKAIEDDIAEIRQALKDGQRQRGTDWRQLAYGALIPALLFVASVLAASRAGH